MFKAAVFYINDHNLFGVEAHPDIIAIIMNKKGIHLEHLEDAFYHF